MTPKPCRIPALITTLSMLACNARIDVASDAAEATTGSESTSGEPLEPLEIPPSAFDEPGPLLDPVALGFDLDPSLSAFEPRVTRVEADRLADLDPSFSAIEIVADVDLDSDAPSGIRSTLVIRGVRSTCEDDMTMLLEVDTRAPEATFVAAPEMLAAVRADVAAYRNVAGCDDKDDGAQAGPPPGPGQAGFWQQEPCEEDREQAFVAFALWQAGAGVVLHTDIPQWRARCGEYPDFESCLALVDAIEQDVGWAWRRIAGAQAANVFARARVEQAMEHAAAMPLGAGFRAQNWADAQYLIETAFQIEGVGAYARTQAAIARGNLGEAITLTYFHTALASARPRLEAIEALATDYSNELGEVFACYERIAWWLAVAGGLGFGFGFFLGGGGGGPGGGGGNLQPGASSEFLDGGVLLGGPILPHAWAVHEDEPIVVDIGTLPSNVAAHSRWTVGADVVRTLYAGYEQPGPDARTGDAIWIPEPYTGIPMIKVPANTLVGLGTGGPGNEPQWVPHGVYAFGQVTLGGAGRELVYQEVDEDLQPLDDTWAICETVEDRFCKLELVSTSPPDDIEAGVELTRQWRVWSTGGTVDPHDGTVVEPMVGFIVRLVAPAEGPSSPCYTWTGNAYVWNDLLPGCDDHTPPPPGP